MCLVFVTLKLNPINMIKWTEQENNFIVGSGNLQSLC